MGCVSQKKKEQVTPLQSDVFKQNSQVQTQRPTQNPIQKDISFANNPQISSSKSSPIINLNKKAKPAAQTRVNMQGYIKDNKSSQVTIRTDTLPPISQGRKANAANLFDENPDNLQDLSDNQFKMDFTQTRSFVENFVEDQLIPALSDFVRVPNCSINFDPDWEKSGTTYQAMEVYEKWFNEQQIPGGTWTLFSEEGVPPLAFIEIPSNCNKQQALMMYGHIDKQPIGGGWSPELDPHTPNRVNDRLYGRGACDNGPAFLMAIAAIKTVQQQGGEHGHIYFVLESEEESGSPHFNQHLQKFKERVRNLSAIINLDSTGGGYTNFWSVNSLRGCISVIVKVSVLTQGMHSGHASGAVPSSFRILRQLLDRIENELTGEIILPELQCDIVPEVYRQTAHYASVIGSELIKDFYFKDNTKPVKSDTTELLINRAWKAGMEVVGIDGVPEVAKAGNVLRQSTSAKISIRIPPVVNAIEAINAVTRALSENIPYDALVEVRQLDKVTGWYVERLPDWLHGIWSQMSETIFGRELIYIGAGGTVPFVGTLSREFPGIPIVCSGVSQPDSNIHGPNESVNLEYLKSFVVALAFVIAEHAKQ